MRVIRLLRYDVECDTMPEDFAKYCVSTVEDPDQLGIAPYSLDMVDKCKTWLSEKINTVSYDGKSYKFTLYTIEYGDLNDDGYLPEESYGASETEYFGC